MSCGEKVGRWMFLLCSAPISGSGMGGFFSVGVCLCPLCFVSLLLCSVLGEVGDDFDMGGWG